MLNDIYQSIDPVLFAFGPFTVRWYGVAYVLGFVFAGLVIWRVARRWRVRVDADSLLTIMFCVIIGVIVGGRLGYVLFYGEGYYFQHPEQILAFNKGGMSFHGGLIGALLAGIAAAKLTRIPYLTLADLGCIGAPLGLLFGRCANFINGELWGAPTDAAWGVVFGGAAGTMPRHPSQLYEAFLEGVSAVATHAAASARHVSGHVPRHVRMLPLPRRVCARARRAAGLSMGWLAYHGAAVIGAADPRGRRRAGLCACREKAPKRAS